MSPRVLLIGGSGQVGTAIREHLEQVVAPTRRELDLSRLTPDAIQESIDDIRPDAVVNCSGYTAVDRAQNEADLADIVNGASVGLLAEASQAVGIAFVTFSTDYVFSGQSNTPYLESSEPDPINAYGRSKLLGEQLALEANPKSLVIRTSWLVSGTHRNFAGKILRLAVEGRPFKVVDDERGCPTIATDLARATVEALRLGATGLLHLTNSGDITWFDLARAVVAAAGFDARLVLPCPSSDFPTLAPRPPYSVLGSERLDEVGLRPLPPWEESLPQVVRQLMTV